MIEITEKTYKAALNEVAATDAGKLIFASLMIDCRWNATIVSTDNPQTTQFYAAQRSVYGALRANIKTEYLKHIEFNYRSKPHDSGTRDTKRISKPSDKPGSRISKPSDRK